jgi:hypothetical protein
VGRVGRTRGDRASGGSGERDACLLDDEDFPPEVLVEALRIDVGVVAPLSCLGLYVFWCIRVCLWVCIL